MGRNSNRNSMSEEEQLMQALSGAPRDSEKLAESTPREADAKLPQQPIPQSRRGQKNTNRGRVDIIRQTAHRGGKAVTVVQNFKGIGMPEKQALAKKRSRSAMATSWFSNPPDPAHCHRRGTTAAEQILGMEGRMSTLSGNDFSLRIALRTEVVGVFS
jgi:translation initiation factor 1 (eIF-1/SUI1)